MRRRRREMFITPCTRVRGGGERGGGGEYISLSPGFQESWICELVRRRRRRRRRRPRPVVRAAYFEGNGGREFSFFLSFLGEKMRRKLLPPPLAAACPPTKVRQAVQFFPPLGERPEGKVFDDEGNVGSCDSLGFSTPALFFARKCKCGVTPPHNNRTPPRNCCHPPPLHQTGREGDSLVFRSG